ncbi:MAG: hypothetical protein JW883_09680 [Deltaproteobacteria bacterium]|nr:hypothetical protein [Deltaproteobacteria bacterium]
MDTDDKNKEGQISEDAGDLSLAYDDEKLVMEGSGNEPGLSEDLFLETEAEGEEEVIELVDAVTEESEGQDVLELTDRVEDQYSQAEEEDLLEFSGADLAYDEPDEDGLAEDVGMEITEEPPEISVTEERADDLEISRDVRDAAAEGDEIPEDLGGFSESDVEQDAGELVEPSASYPEQELVSEAGAQAADKALGPEVLERLSDERIEEIVVRVVKETVEKKADRILLEVAEAAIAKEIEKIKQAL